MEQKNDSIRNGADAVSSFLPASIMSRAGLGTRVPFEDAQVVDFNKKEKRSNRSFRQFEVHRRYTGYGFLDRALTRADCLRSRRPISRLESSQRQPRVTLMPNKGLTGLYGEHYCSDCYSAEGDRRRA